MEEAKKQLVNKERVINILLSRIAKLEYEVEEIQKENDLDHNLNKSLLKDIDKAGKEMERLNNIINESRRILGEYKHFSTPTEEQNSENEDIVDKAYLTLHENLRK